MLARTGPEPSAGDPDRLTLAEILRFGASRVADDSTCPQVQSVLAKISLCRTHWLGGRKYQCEDCDEITTRYNSCGDRHCPRCSGSKRADFNQKASKLLLPGVKHYQVVFTLPRELSLLALANRRAIRRLERLRSAGQLKLCGKFAYLQSDENWEAFVRQLKSTEWVAYIQPPPSPSSQANEVVNYLTRYLTGGPISDHRITAADAREVTFLAREGQRTGGDREQVPVRLSVEDFVRRWSLHIQPEQLTKTRYLGGWSNTRREFYMSRCLELLSTAASVRQASESPRVDDSSRAEASPLVCSNCGSERLQQIEDRPRPSWRELFRSTSASCPTWYARLQEAEAHRFWDGLMGAGFNDWYLEYAIESAKEPPSPPPPRPIQLYLPGLFPRRDFALESY